VVRPAADQQLVASRAKPVSKIAIRFSMERFDIASSTR